MYDEEIKDIVELSHDLEDYKEDYIKKRISFSSKEEELKVQGIILACEMLLSILDNI